MNIEDPIPGSCDPIFDYEVKLQREREQKTMNNTFVYMQNHLGVVLDYLTRNRMQLHNNGFEDIDYLVEQVNKAMALIPLCTDCGADLYDKHYIQVRNTKLCRDCHDKMMDKHNGDPENKFPYKVIDGGRI